MTTTGERAPGAVWTAGAEPAPEPAGRRRRGRWVVGTGVVVAVGLVVAGAVVSTHRSGGPVTSGPVPAPVVVDGAPHLEGGVLVGFPRTEAGARAAALNMDVALGSQLMYEPGSRHALLAAIGAPGSLSTLQAWGDATYSPGLNTTLGLDAGGQPIRDGLTFVARRVPVGSQVAGWTPASAVVQVWLLGLHGLAGQGSTTPVREGWETDTVTLTWQAGGWRYVSETGVLGPVPVVGAQAPSDSADLATAVEFGAPSLG